MKQLRARFRRQFPIGPYVVDFVALRSKLIIEIDGGQHSPEADATRTTWLETRGFTVLRFWNHDVLQNPEGVVRVIEDKLAKNSSR